MDAQPPCADEHSRVLVLVRQLGNRSTTSFNRLIERFQRVRCLQVSENPRRVIVANFVQSPSATLARFGELQAHRRVVGFVGVVQAPPSGEEPSTSNALNALTVPPEVVITPFDDDYRSLSRKNSTVSYVPLSQIKEQYDAIKEEYASTLLDSRCIAFGYTEESLGELFASRELSSFACLDRAESLEEGVRELLRSIYYVLESRRLDLSFEKLDPAPCPSLPDEQRYLMGTEKNAKLYRKKCLGRLRKQIADYTLLTGLPTLALEAYQAAIDYLKQANDLLWLAGAYEGWACAAMAIKYDFGEECVTVGGMQRASTMTPEQMRSAQTLNARPLGTFVGHQRHRSDIDRLTVVPSVTDSPLSNDDQQRWSFRLPWNFDRSGRANLEHTEIIEKFKLALENYERFTFAAAIEYECMMKAASVYRFHRLYIDMEAFIREHIGKYLDDGFKLFDHVMKANICLNSAYVYRLIGFMRKYAFFTRLAVLFRLHVDKGEIRTSSDYRLVYPLLYRTLVGYGIPENPKDISGDLTVLGPVHVQRRALHEVFMSALRAEYFDAAVRHLCYLLQVYYEYMDVETSSRMIDDLTRLVESREMQHQLNQHIMLPNCGIIIPPLQVTRFPRLDKFRVCSLPAHLAPVVMRPRLRADIFIYSPFQNNDLSSKAINWVVDCACEVSVNVTNCLPFELSVCNLSLLSEGCAFETFPVSLNLAPSLASDPLEIRLIGVPRASGKLTITGYSCEVFGLRSVCRLRDLPSSSKDAPAQSSVFDVHVLPALPVLVLETSLSRAPISEEDMEPTAETTVYSGQTFEHTISIVNTSASIAIRDIRLEINQPKVCGGPCLIDLVDDCFKNENEVSGGNSNGLNRGKALRRLEPLEKKKIKFRIFGIDPSATAEDGSKEGVRDVEREPAPSEQSLEDAHDRIPFTGRLLTSDFVFRYKADIDGPDGEEYERRCRLPLAVSIVPAVTVAAWHVLPGDGPSTRYVVVDVTNSTEWDAELTYGRGKLIGVQPREICRVPLLCECCGEVASNAFHLAANRASHMMQMQEMERLRQVLERHVSAHLDIRWSISACGLEGSVPVGPILSSVSLLKQLVVPAISIEVCVNGTPYLSEDDIVVGVGEILNLCVQLVCSVKDDRSFKGLLRLSCYRDMLNGLPVIDSNDSLIVLGIDSVPFSLSAGSNRKVNRQSSVEKVGKVARENDYAPNVAADSDRGTDASPNSETMFTAHFTILFRYEGVHKVKPMLTLSEESSSASEGELFCSAVSFSVVTKVS